MSDNNQCNKTVHQLVEVEAEVTIIPHLKHVKPKTSCVETDVQPGCCHRRKKCKRSKKCCRKCTYCVSQVLCVEIPIDFEVDVDVEEGITRCGTPHVGPCNIVSQDYSGPEPVITEDSCKPGKHHKRVRQHNNCNF